MIELFKLIWLSSPVIIFLCAWLRISNLKRNIALKDQVIDEFVNHIKADNAAMMAQLEDIEKDG